MAEKKKAGRPGRKPPAGTKKQFLTSMDPEVIRRIKAAALKDRTVSLVLEEAAREVARAASGREEVRSSDTRNV
jgi:hypothetical protein